MYLRSLVVLFLVIFANRGEPALAQTESLDQTLIEKNREISEKIDDAAAATDIYLSGKEYVDEPNRTRIIIFNNLKWRQSQKPTFSPHLGVRLHLPNLQKKFQLRFTTYDEDVEERGINKNRYKTEQRENNYGTSLALFQDLGKVKTEFRPRIEFRDKLETSYIFRFFSEAKVKFFILQPEIQLFARSDSGTGQYAALNFTFELSPANNLSLINEEQYTDGDNTMSTNNGFRWVHTYNKVMAHEYSVIFESNNRAKYHLERYTIASGFNHQVYRNVLHYTVTPYLVCEKPRKFKPEAGIDFRLEIIF